MTTSHARLYRRAAFLIAAGCVLLAVHDPSSNSPGPFAIAFLIGTLFGQTTVAAFWTVFGVSALPRRLLFSMAWIATMLISAAIRFGDGADDFFLLTALVLGFQYVLVQIPLWPFAVAYRLHLQLHEEVSPTGGRAPQFGLRQLMVFTTLVAIVLGLSRFVVNSGIFDRAGQVLLGVLFLAFAAILITLPLGLAAIIPRRAWIGVLLVLGLEALATAWELPIAKKLFGGGGPEMLDLIWINTFASVWVLVFAVMIRLSGYRLTSLATSPTQL